MMLRIIFKNGQTCLKYSPKGVAKIKLRHSKSTYSGGSKVRVAYKYILPIAVTVIGVGAGIVGFAYTSADRRKRIELAIPGSSYIIEAALGPHEKSIIIPAFDKDPLTKKLSKKFPKEPNSILNKTDSDETTASLPHILKSTTTSSIPADDIKPEVSDTAIPVENVEQTPALEDLILSAQKRVTAALNAAEDASAAVHEHANIVYEAIDSEENNETLYEVAAKVGKVKKELVKIAEEQLNMAKSDIECLQMQMKSDKLVDGNNYLPLAEAALTELQYDIKKINKTLDDAFESSNSINNYKDLVEKGWNQFFGEIQSIIPDAKLSDSGNNLTREELFLLLIHAHHKVSSMQKSKAKLETVEKVRLQDSIIIPQLNQGIHFSDSRLLSELENQRRELGLEHRHRLSQLKDDMEIELRTQLKRQAAAHSDHLADVIYAKEKELNLLWENKLLDESQTKRDEYHKSISVMKAHVGGVKTMVKSRADVDKAAHAAHLLWMACESLSAALRLCKADSHTWNEKLQPLKEMVDAIQLSVDGKDSFVEVVLNSLPDEVLTRGVYSEDALKERFLKVDTVCNKVAFVTDNGGSLLRYMLSCFQSLLLLNAFEQPPNSEILDKEVNVDNFNTRDILARTRYCLDKDDLLQAVKYMNLLSGEPERVASDWLREAKLTLEVKQVAVTLMSYAAAVGIKAL